MQSKIKNCLLVFSGKGGVGKSTVVINLARSFTERNLKVGLLDADIHGPNLALMLGAQDKIMISYGEDKIIPVEIDKNLSLVSIAYLIPSTDTPIIWRGPAKMRIIEKFIKDVDWGELDWLIIDSPPGTGDEPISVVQLLPNVGAVIVTTPQEASLLDSKKAINFAKELKLKIYGLIENMSGLICSHCGQKMDLFKKGGGIRIAEDYKIPFLGSIPIDSEIVVSGDNGTSFIVNNNKEIKDSFSIITDKILNDK
jgi:Mrp family chromosome partitioning ATPase